MDTSASDLMILVVVGIGVFLGLFTFMNEMDDSSAYNITVPEGTKAHMEELNQDMNDTSGNIQGAFTEEQSWIQTTFSIFFSLPGTVINSISTIANSAYKLSSMAQGADSDIPTPSWVINLIYILVSIVIVTTIVYLALGRRM